MNQTELNRIVAAAKNELDITCDDQSIADKVNGIVARAIKYLDDVAAENMEYKEGSIELGLLINYTRYAIEGMENEFEKNYRSELIRLRLQKEAGRSANQEGV